MKKLISKIDNTILHIIYKQNQRKNERIELVDDEQYIQASIINCSKGKTFAAHKHLYKDINLENIITQEAWVIISGSVEVTYYDLDDSKLDSVILNKGDLTITLFGGHSYEILDNDTVIYEFKTGPYLGTEKDKVYIK